MRLRKGTFVVAFAVLGILLLAMGLTQVQATMPCDPSTFAGLKDQENNSVTVTTNTISASGSVPAYCDVKGTILPAINFEVALPTTTWNNKFYMAGGGGFNGSLPDLTQGLILNYVTAGTDSGHVGTPLDASFAYPPSDTVAAQKKIDFSYRSYKEVALIAKTIIADFYSHGPQYSYWVGCSEGGREALMMAQRFPTLFNGIIAGAPVLYLTKAHMWSVWNPIVLGEGGVTADQMPALADAIYNQCDGIDGLKDGLINDPRKCHFDPRHHLPICKTASATCFTKAQAEALYKVYDGVRNSAGELLFPGQPRGAEVLATPGVPGSSGWIPWLLPLPGLQGLIGQSSMQYFTLTPPPGPTWVYTDYNFDTDPPKMLQTSAMVDMINPNLSDFKFNGGKMIHYAGWNDTALTPLMTTNYYESVQDFMGKKNTDEFYKLYMIPGMAHCGGGVGCFNSGLNGDVVMLLNAVVKWVEQGIEPTTFVGSRVVNGQVVRTRPLCPYPSVEKYHGTGDINDAANFHCVGPSVK